MVRASAGYGGVHSTDRPMACERQIHPDLQGGAQPPALISDEAVQAQVALRLATGLIEELIAAGVLEESAAARIATLAAGRAWQGRHSRREEIAAAILRLIPG